MKMNKLFFLFFIIQCTLLLSFFVNAYAQPEMEQLRHINKNYLTKCPEPSAKTYTELQKTLDTLDQMILNTISTLTDDNKLISQTIKEIDDAFKQIDEKIMGKDLNKKSEEVLTFADDLKGRLTKIKEQIINAKGLTEASQKKVGSFYCRIGKYKDIYTQKMNNSITTAERTLNKDSAERLEKKRYLIVKLMQEFDIYWGYLEELHKISEKHYQELHALQDNIVIYINQTCKRKKREECIYEEVGFIKLNRVKLYRLVNDYKKSLKYVVENGPSYIEK